MGDHDDRQAFPVGAGAPTVPDPDAPDEVVQAVADFVDDIVEDTGPGADESDD